ncbi:MAG: glycosyltransferase family 39 protein [Candidatus Moraniibacteriota bacterium]
MKIVLSKKIKSLPKHFWILLAIILLGVFLRTYHFSDWLKFNSDQARDASIVRDMVEKGDMPLLGPVAGGTFFQLGPAFYYFQYVGAKIFGSTPDKMAYADLLFGILAIPLLYLLARQYFHKNISLVLTALYACAFFTVQYSRFAWNPNSAQFFSLLFFYSIVRLWNDQSNRKWLWLVLAGISLGIGMQLHTLLLFGMPFALFVLALYLWKNKRIKLVGIGTIIVVALLLNGTQILSEMKTGGTNYWEFKQALLKKSGNQNPLWKNALFIASCQAQANIKILAPQANQENCDFPLADKYFKRLKSNIQDFSDWLFYGGKIIVVALFLVSSYGLMYRKRKKDGDGPAVLLLLFNLALLFVFVPFGAEISLRYFILLAFVPFLLLGACLEFVLEKCRPRLKFWMLVGVFSLIAYNVYFCFLTFHAQANNLPGNTVDGTAIQAEAMADYIIEKSGFAKKIQIGGQKIYVGRFYNRMAYFAKNKGVEMLLLNGSEDVSSENWPIFVAIDDMSKECPIGEYYKYGRVKDCQKMYAVSILSIER